MENGVAIAEDVKLGETNAVSSEVSLKENFDSSLDGLKDSDGDEEAVEAEAGTVGSEYSTVAEDGNAELSATLENDNKDKEVNSELFQEAHKFEEVAGVPVGAVPEDARDESKILTSDDNQHGVGKVASDETNGSEYGTMVIGENAELSGTLENNNNDKKVNSDLFQEAHMVEDMIETLGVVPEDATAKSKILTSDDKQIGVEKVVSDETNGSTDDGIAEHLNGGYEKSDDSDRMPEDDNISGLTSGGAKIPGKDTREKPIVEISEALAPKDDAKAFPHELLTETQDDDICSDIPETGSLYHMNLAAIAMKVQIHKTAQEFEGEQNGTKESEPNFNNQNSNSGYEIDSANLHSESNDHEEDYSTSYAESNDIGNTDMKKLELESLQAVKIESQVVDMEENSGIPAPGASATATDDLEESSGLNTNSHPVLEDSTSNLEKAGVEPQVSSSESLPESSSSSTQPEVPINIKREEQEGVKNEKNEQYLSGNSEQDVTHVTEQDVTPVTERGVTPVTASGHAAKVQEPVSQYTSPNDGKQEFKVDNSVTTQPDRVTQRSETTPLPEPASQIKERVSNITTSLTPNRPAGLGRATALSEPTSRVAHQQPRVNGAISAPKNQLIEDPMSADAEEYDETREKLQMIRVKFLRLARRLGQTPHNVVVAQVLYRLGLAEQLHGRSGGRVGAFSFDRASAMAEQLEAVGQEPLDFSCTIMVIGKSGVGKSATINSIFDEAMFVTDAFQSSTTKVQDIVGTVQGIRVRVIDTPGLLPSWSDQGQNEKILRSVKNFIRKMPPDIVLYLDRLDMQNRDSGDTPLLRTITEIFEPSIWFNAIVVLTHAASAPPEGPNGTATSYDMFVTQRSHVVQQAIRQAAGDMRLMNPVSLVENHSACRTNRAGQRVLPNGQVWKPHLLLLSFASKILAEANTLLKLQDTTPPGRSAPRTRSPPLPFLLSSLLQSRPEIKLPSVQFGGDDDEDGNVDDDLDGDSDPEEESEYDELPPFKSLTKAQLEILSKAQRKAYYDELEYREKLFMKKQLREERKRRKLMKKLQEVPKDLPVNYIGDNNSEEETGGAASVPVPMPDLALPASFDSDNPTHRYRSLDSSNQWLVRAVMEPNGWDHDIGYDGINIERLFVAKEKIPISFSGHISKDKKDASLQMEVASSVKHGKGKATQLGFDMQPLGKDYAYTLRSETRFINHRISKAAAGISATVLGDVITGGVKLEDKLTIGKRGQIVVSGGAIYGRGEAAYGGSLEATLRDKEHPLGRFLTTLGLSVMDWHGELAVGCNSQTQIPIGRNTNLIGRVNVNNRGSGQVSVKVNSSEQLQIVLIGLIPLVKKVFGYYSPQAQYG